MSYKNQRIGHIVAMDRNNAIGFNNKIPWHIPNDLKHFKKMTTQETDTNIEGIVFMGRKTFESMGCKPLPNRLNIILTSDEDYHKLHPKCQIVDSVEKGLDFMAEFGEIYDIETAWVIGGERLFLDTLEYADVLEITHVNTEVSFRDALYPINPREGRYPAKLTSHTCDFSGLSYHHMTYLPNKET